MQLWPPQRLAGGNRLCLLLCDARWTQQSSLQPQLRPYWTSIAIETAVEGKWSQDEVLAAIGEASWPTQCVLAVRDWLISSVATARANWSETSIVAAAEAEWTERAVLAAADAVAPGPSAMAIQGSSSECEVERECGL